MARRLRALATAATWPTASKLSGRVVELARVQIRQRGMGETVQQLTAVLLVLLARQGRHGVWRIDGGDPRVRGGRRARSRRHGAPGGAWIGAEDAGVEAELVA